MFVFAYGSLLSHRSAATSLPGLDAGQCVPAQLAGHVRTFDVAFPNDTTQPDKRYYHHDGSRPEAVLFANLRPSGAAAPVNGVLLPMVGDQLNRLMRRERRYRLVEVTALASTYPSWSMPRARIFAFVGRASYTESAAVARGVVPSSYLGTIKAGVADWDRRCPGFAADFAASTQAPSDERVIPLRRIDLPA
jgi:hypothetical protein